ncbi:type II toxin-antitoxin system RelE/ParE family toxin [Gracilimonas mengyeensis]|uniref:Plasmid stabilization system protein ParE n=1 Tax=Gracilimonas mengyeensis TaxID=1302730 RepID=A0A521EAD4_9BACT|nr:type II toxin-antitoxin system RelE/ParE family toxin [Gracilimonas mengyeensis]SMO80897.1 Plasmid stabilization system protein ParE [Gracilimonas mengyeensis]
MSNLAFELDDAAEAEFYDIIEYYKQFDKELSLDFVKEFDDAVQRLMKFPKAGHPYLHQTQRIFLNRFPYAIVYKLYRDELIVVFAIMHMRRKPDYWEKRLNP